MQDLFSMQENVFEVGSDMQWCTKLLSSTDVSCGALLKLLVKFPITGEVDPKLILQGTVHCLIS